MAIVNPNSRFFIDRNSNVEERREDKGKLMIGAIITTFKCDLYSKL